MSDRQQLKKAEKEEELLPTPNPSALFFSSTILFIHHFEHDQKNSSLQAGQYAAL